VSIDTKASTSAEAPDPAERRPRPRPGQTGRRMRRPIGFVLALAFFFGPAVAYGLGVRPQEIENRRLRALPSVTEGWSFFPSFATWATDHLPLRKQAVEGNTTLSEHVFGEPPSYGSDTNDAGVAGVPGTSPGGDRAADAGKPAYPQVIQGKNGWLYLGGDASSPCQPVHSVDDTLARLTRLAQAVQKSGRRFVLTVAPDKSTVWPQQLPDSYLGKSCAQARRAEFWSKLRASPPPGYVDVLGPIQAAQRADGVPAYRQTDTHWGDRGVLAYAQGIADALQPGLWKRLSVRPAGTRTRAGDLGVLLGRPHVDSYPGFQLSRPGAPWSYTMPIEPLTDPIRVQSGPVPAGLPLITEPTLLLGDSFTNSSRTMLPQLFTSLTLLHNEAAGARPDAVAHAMVNSDAVVYEIVERTISAGGGALIQDRSLAAIEKALAANPR
jgi:alginate O-acetyltransferase complex protein AlgJ